MNQPRQPKGGPRGGQFLPSTHDEAEDVELLRSDGFPPGLERVLNTDTRAAWRQIREFVPPGSYLAGGTAVAIHLRHRESRDLDFFTTVPLAVEDLHEALERSTLPYIARRVLPKLGNIAITLGETKVEFSDGSMVTMVEPVKEINGIQVAGMGDLLAMKLLAITKRRVLRDFEDLRVIEEIGGRRFEEGLALAKRRYHLKGDASIVPIVAAFTRVEECEPDELIETPKEVLVEFFHRRLPEVITSLGRWDASSLPPELAARVARAIRDGCR